MSDGGTQMVNLPVELETELTEMISVHAICRICANQSDKLIGIYSEDGISNELANKINLYLPIKVTEVDNLPLQCCWQCASTVLAWHDLVITSTEADKRLRSYQLVTEKQLQDVTSYRMSETEISRDSDGHLDTSTISKGPHLFDNINEEQDLCDDANLKFVANSIENDEDEMCTSEDLDLELENTVPYVNVKKDVMINNKIVKTNAVGANGAKQVSEISDVDEEYGFECPICSNVFSAERDISQHVKRSHSNVNTDDVFFGVKDLESKAELKMPPKKKPRVSRRFTVKHMMNKPQQKIDQELVNKAKLVVDGRVFYKCKECGKSLHSMYTYVWHMRIHTGERPYVCDLCGKQFRVSQGLVRHLKETHERIKNFECDICGRYFSTKRNVEEHRRIHTNERPYVCALCGKSFKQKASLFVHNRSHSTEFPFNCTYCPQKFRTKQSLITHITRHTGEKPFPCDVCGRRFRIKYELKRHKLVHSEDKPFSCKMCGQTFRQKRYLRNHLKLNHHIANPNDLIDVSCPQRAESRTFENKHTKIEDPNVHSILYGNDVNSLDGFETEIAEAEKTTNLKAENITKSEKNLNQHKCNICEKSFDAKMLLKKHLQVLHNLKQTKIRRRKCEISALFKCFFCEKSYSRKHDMEKHSKQQHPDQTVGKPKDMRNTLPSICKVTSESGNVIYKCDFCDKTFQKSYNLGRHRTIHTNMKPHCCHLCGKGFRLNSNLTRHISEYHDNKRKFECSMCNKIFKNKSTRDQHLNIHNDLRPFVCDVCGKSFRQSASLYVHKQFHTDNYPHACAMCGKTFRRKHNLKEHNFIHTGYKPFKCEDCQMAFRQKHELRRHSRCHMTAVCERCGVSFEQARNLSMHKRKCRQSLVCLKK